ncbi:adenine nucleotide alpha hydrolases-like protein [Xylariomycetidae sp. FL2044]|nr:adenine nucleotide alpha hydrolases-like protein [Xylariomycetidae sp. FL2044]
MTRLQNVFHASASARAISVQEFADALRATCPPRWPRIRRTRHTKVAMAVSGGVDSMALAYLCSRLRLYDPDFKISDSPVGGFRAIIVDHQLREGSALEARAVAGALKDMDIPSDIFPINWEKVLGPGVDPRQLTNLESVARTWRYRNMGTICARDRIASLLLAHHEDDQYETILMRLLTDSHGNRGLRGMMRASDIPECADMYGAYQSGHLDQPLDTPRLYEGERGRVFRRLLREKLYDGITRQLDEEELGEITASESNAHYIEEFYSQPPPSIEPRKIDVEDGGIFVYRPFLEFSKDRLIATCLENNVPWWEDLTNRDPRLTTRNAVRHMWKNHELPVALQKPSILRLARTNEKIVQALDAEARRLLGRTTVHDFEPIAGTLTVQFPDMSKILTKRDLRSPIRREARVSRHREAAAILLRNMLVFVKPDIQPVPLPNLQTAVSQIFPCLSAASQRPHPGELKSFNVADVHMVPIKLEGQSHTPVGGGSQTTWYLSRAPYVSHQPAPALRSRYHPPKVSQNRHGSPRWPALYGRWELWDGRYWIRIKNRLPYRLIVRPFAKEHSKPFRKLLSPSNRRRLDAYLKRYAPGKVRFTLPAIYINRDLDLDNPVPSADDADPPPPAVDEAGVPVERPSIPDLSKMKLVALPTLDTQIPKLEDWVAFDIRYRRVDRDTLEAAGLFRRSSFASPMALQYRRRRKLKR